MARCPRHRAGRTAQKGLQQRQPSLRRPLGRTGGVVGGGQAGVPSRADGWVAIAAVAVASLRRALDGGAAFVADLGWRLGAQNVALHVGRRSSRPMRSIGGAPSCRASRLAIVGGVAGRAPIGLERAAVGRRSVSHPLEQRQGLRVLGGTDTPEIAVRVFLSASFSRRLHGRRRDAVERAALRRWHAPR